MPGTVPTHRMIEAFRATVVHDGIGAAAEALGMSQSSMSRTIAELQNLVGFPLFVKQGRKVKPTQEAFALIRKVEQSFLGLEDIGRFSEQLKKHRMGRLSICAIPALGNSIMPDAIKYLREKYPTVVISMDIRPSIDVTRSVVNRQCDVGFAVPIGTAPDGVEIVAELDGDCVCIATAGALPKEWTYVDMQQLSGRPFVALTGMFQKRLETMMIGLSGGLDIMAEASHALSASDLVLRGVGISVVDPFTGGVHRSRGGVTLPLRPNMPHKMHALAMGDTKLIATAKDLVQYVKSAADSLRAETRRN